MAGEREEEEVKKVESGREWLYSAMRWREGARWEREKERHLKMPQCPRRQQPPPLGQFRQRDVVRVEAHRGVVSRGRRAGAGAGGVRRGGLAGDVGKHVQGALVTEEVQPGQAAGRERERESGGRGMGMGQRGSRRGGEGRGHVRSDAQGVGRAAASVAVLTRHHTHTHTHTHTTHTTHAPRCVCPRGVRALHIDGERQIGAGAGARAGRRRRARSAVLRHAYLV